MVQLGGQTALKLAANLLDEGVPILGTPYECMDLAEDRGKFSRVLKELEIPFPPYGMARTVEEAVEVAEGIGYPHARPPQLRARRAGHADRDQQGGGRRVRGAHPPACCPTT